MTMKKSKDWPELKVSSTGSKN
jgi:hypothetical protein